jgi:hypothetical protein
MAVEVANNPNVASKKGIRRIDSGMIKIANGIIKTEKNR